MRLLKTTAKLLPIVHFEFISSNRVCNINRNPHALDRRLFLVINLRRFAS